MEISEEIKKEVQDILDRERWQGYVGGKVEGALNVLYAMDLSKEQRLELLSNAVGLSEATATGFLEPREIEERIYKNESLSIEDKDALSALMSKEYPVSEFYSTPKVLEEAMRFYINHLITVIKEVLSEGYDWDVITSMTRDNITEERYHSLVNAFVKEGADE